MSNKWSEHFWFVIEKIVSDTHDINMNQSRECLSLLSRYLPCQKCRNHFDLFISKNNIINNEWLKKLKYEINITQTKKSQKKCCGK